MQDIMYSTTRINSDVEGKVNVGRRHSQDKLSSAVEGKIYVVT